MLLLSYISTWPTLILHLCLCLVEATLLDTDFFMGDSALPNTEYKCDSYFRLFGIHRSTHKSNYQ